MEIIFSLIGVSVVLVVLIAVVLLWAIRSGQFEDMDGPAWRIIMDDDRPQLEDEHDTSDGDEGKKVAHEQVGSEAVEQHLDPDQT